ncbi:MAG: hypothetical protein WD877_00785 [Candidatus Saccharimonadales bacterium]
MASLAIDARRQFISKPLPRRRWRRLIGQREQPQKERERVNSRGSLMTKRDRVHALRRLEAKELLEPLDPESDRTLARAAFRRRRKAARRLREELLALREIRLSEAVLREHARHQLARLQLPQEFEEEVSRLEGREIDQFELEVVQHLAAA